MRRFVLLYAFFVVTGFLAERGFAEVERTEEIHRTIPLDDRGAGTRVVVDNVWGSITVEGHPGGDVEMNARRTLRAGSEKDYESDLREVDLRITVGDSVVEFYVDGPFRDSHRGEGRRRDWDGEALYEFEVRVPRDVDLEVRTVNDGEIEVRDVWGDFVAENVNGGIEMSGLRGSGNAYAVNGDVRLRFDKDPSSDCRFGSLNGEVRVYFTPGLGAEFRLKTFNGEVFTDFPLTYLPPVVTTESCRKDGRTFQRLNVKSAVRAGLGGPVIELDGFNGDMFILKRT